MVKRTVLALLFAAATLAAMIGIEVVYAARRPYLPSTPALDISGTFGHERGAPLTFVVLGDSTAAGVGAVAPELAYPTVLAGLLADEGYRVELVGLGVSGARVGDLLEDPLSRAVDERPDLVFIGIGANDATHLVRASDVERDMGEVLDRLDRETDAAVVVAGPPNMAAPAFAEPLRSVVAWRGRVVSEAIEKAAESRGVPVVQLAEKTGPLFARDPGSFYSADRFHPSAMGYDAWANVIHPVVVEAVKQRD